MALGLFLRGAAAFSARLGAVARLSRVAAAEACKAVAEEVQDRVETSPRVPKKSGKLAGSWSVRSDERKGTATLSSNAPYARALEYGYRGTVMARSKKGRYYPRKMNVPERRFLRGAVDDTRQTRDEVAARAFRRRLAG